MSDSVRPHRRQPTRLPHPWDSPGKNTGVGCHFLLQCTKVKSESEVTQSCLTLRDPMDCSPLGSSVHGIFQARVLEWGAIAFSGVDSKSPYSQPLQVVKSSCFFCSIIIEQHIHSPRCCTHCTLKLTTSCLSFRAWLNFCLTGVRAGSIFGQNKAMTSQKVRGPHISLVSSSTQNTGKVLPPQQVDKKQGFDVTNTNFSISFASYQLGLWQTM